MIYELLAANSFSFTFYGFEFDSSQYKVIEVTREVTYANLHAVLKDGWNPLGNGYYKRKLNKEMVDLINQTY